MVDNPIYISDIPMYESVRAQPDTQLTAKLSDSTNHYEILKSPKSDGGALDTCTARYVDQSNIPRQNSESLINSSNCAPSSKDDTENVLLRSNSTSLLAKGMALKCNGQPRNKLNLTLTLGTTFTSCEDLSSCTTMARDTFKNLSDSLSQPH